MRRRVDRFGHVDVWVNNVGVGVFGRFDETPIESHARVVEANLLGEMNGAHAVVPHFRARRRGTLVNMISIGGWAPTPMAASYGASKYGLRGFSEALRAELSDLPDVHVCVVAPTFVDTPGMAHGANHTGKRLRPPPPLLDPRTVAARIVALADRPRARTFIGSVALPARIANTLMPGLVGAIAMRAFGFALDRAGPARTTSGNLFAPSSHPAIDGGYRRSGERSIAVPAAAGLLALGAWLVVRAHR